MPNEGLAPYCLMVGTIEPRKNYPLALDVFELLWSKGFPLNLVIVGKPGWLVDSLLIRLREHKQLNKRLFFFDHCSDEDVARLYSNAAVLLFISKDEGFGLPLVEAAKYGIPIICSDIPIFREIAAEHATYVAIEDPEQLAREIGEWWQRSATGDVPQSSGMPRLSWEESAQALFNVVVGQNWYWTK
jgi:glycosyltransferase involved in cell wall biosynthesis